jgi:hypothetical protein
LAEVVKPIDKGQATGGGVKNGMVMRTERARRWVAEWAEVVLGLVPLGCAIFLLFGPVADRTSWTSGSTTITDAAAYNVAALFSGVLALAALGVAFWARPRVILPVLSAAVAIAAFGLTAYVAGIYWLARLQGEVLDYGAGGTKEKVYPASGQPFFPQRGTLITEIGGEQWRVYPAAGPPFFATAAIIGAVSTLVLAISWLRQSHGKAVPRVPPG